jgi:hypothetical protein
MRKWGLLAFGAALGLVACTSILGDFSVGDGGTTDSGNDVQVDDVVTSDVQQDVAVDAGPDVQPIKLANCTLNTTKPTVFSWPAQTPVQDGDRVFVFEIPQHNRLFVQQNSTIWFTDFTDQDATATLQSFGFAGQIISSVHVNGPTVSGTVFLTWDATSKALNVYKWPDVAATTPAIVGNVLPVSALSSGAPLPNFPVKGSITAIDLSVDDYLYAFEYTIDSLGVTYQFGVGHTKGSTYQNLGTNQGPDLDTQMISHDATSAYFWAQPGSNGNAPSGPSSLYVMDIQTWAKTNVLQLQPQTGFYLPFAMATGAQGMTDVAFLEGDLSNQNAIPVVHAQSIQTSTLPTFKPQNVPSAPVSITGLPFNKGVTHWWPYPNEDEWIGAGRPLNDGVAGVNIVWFDSNGNARAFVQETDGGGGFPSIPVESVDMTFTAPPSLVLSSIRAAWIEGQGNQQSPNVISMTGSCSTF